jgi:demethylmenaquinone methyltransferase/2-methoxy-6-polyprenyl-1,4-benzoquinol methylase
MVRNMATDTQGESTHFGFRTIPRDHKAGLVRDLFDGVSGRYDLMNDLMSAGIHRLWKRSMVSWLAPRGRQRVVDVAGGTGDIAFRIVERLDVPSGGRVTVIDASPGMLSRGRDRALDRGLVSGIDWVNGDAECLPIADASVDAYTVAFGIRNMTDMNRVLSEAYRVLSPGGRFLCLEFSHVVLPVLDAAYDAYSFRVLPALGEMIAGDRDAYLYLAESIRRFPRQEDFAAMIDAAGFTQVRVRNLSGGIAALHSAWRT